MEIKNYNVMIDGIIFFDQPVTRYFRTYDSIRNIATVQGDDYTTGCLLDFLYFKKYNKLTATDLSKQQKLDADPKAIQQINFIENLNRVEGATIFLIIEKAKEIVLDFSKGTVKLLWFCFALI